jgi:hypothetical protein
MVESTSMVNGTRPGHNLDVGNPRRLHRTRINLRDQVPTGNLPLQEGGTDTTRFRWVGYVARLVRSGLEWLCVVE